MVFTNHKGFDLVINKLDASKTSAEWNTFKAELNVLYGKYFDKVVVRPTRREQTKEMLRKGWIPIFNKEETQKHSVFEGFTAKALLAGPNGEDLSDPSFSFSINTNLFSDRKFTLQSVPRAKPDATSDAKVKSFPDANADVGDQVLYSQIHFFLPVFAWAFAEIKHALVFSVDRIKTAQVVVDRHQNAIVNVTGAKAIPMKPKKTFDDLSSVAALTDGMARDLTALPYYRLFSNQQTATPSARTDRNRSNSQSQDSIQVKFGNVAVEKKKKRKSSKKDLNVQLPEDTSTY